MSAGRATGNGEMLCLECLAIKVKFPWATVFVHDRALLVQKDRWRVGFKGYLSV